MRRGGTYKNLAGDIYHDTTLTLNRNVFVQTMETCGPSVYVCC